jgi:hypothetical protein
MNSECLNERDLLLLHYREAAEHPQAIAHFAACPSCQARAVRLAADLARIPPLADPDPAVATRLAARVHERLNRPRRWLPAAGAAVAGAIALAVAVVVWVPDSRQPATTNQPLASLHAPATSTQSPGLDLGLLEQLDLLEELETLRAIEGV